MSNIVTTILKEAARRSMPPEFYYAANVQHPSRLTRLASAEMKAEIQKAAEIYENEQESDDEKKQVAEPSTRTKRQVKEAIAKPPTKAKKEEVEVDAESDSEEDRLAEQSYRDILAQSAFFQAGNVQGQTVVGKVTGATRNHLTIDIGTKFDAIVNRPADYYPVRKSDTVEVEVRDLEHTAHFLGAKRSRTTYQSMLALKKYPVEVKASEASNEKSEENAPETVQASTADASDEKPAVNTSTITAAPELTATGGAEPTKVA
eukprot:Colp12_sorted_trinity150504_noHs@30039